MTDSCVDDASFLFSRRQRRFPTPRPSSPAARRSRGAGSGDDPLWRRRICGFIIGKQPGAGRVLFACGRRPPITDLRQGALMNNHKPLPSTRPHGERCGSSSATPLNQVRMTKKDHERFVRKILHATNFRGDMGGFGNRGCWGKYWTFYGWLPSTVRAMLKIIHLGLFIRSTPPSRSNKAGLKCPSARPSTKFLRFRGNLVCRYRGRPVMQRYMQYDPIQGQV